MKEKLQKFISDVGDIETAAIILDISTTTLKKYIDGKVIAESFYKKISPVIDSPMQDLLKILALKIKYLRNDVKELNEKIHELNIDNYRYELSNEKYLKNLKKVIESPLISYINYFGYREDPIHQLEEAIDKLIADEKYPQIYLYHACENYAKVYELFRPFPVSSHDYYHGTVTMIDEIYKFIYGVLFRIEPKVFSRVVMSSYTYRVEKEPYPEFKFEEINWLLFKKNLGKISKAIRNTMFQESIRLFINIGKDIPYQIEDFIKDYVKSFLKDIADKEIEIETKNGRAIVIKGERMVFESEHELRSILENKKRLNT